MSYINCGKTLSKKVVKKINFQEGSFFTDLPANADLTRLYEFSSGGILPLIPYGRKVFGIKSYPEGFQPQKIKTLDRECSEFIADFLKGEGKNYAIVGNYMLKPDSPYVDIKNVLMAPFQDEVYYFLNKENSIEQIHTTIKRSEEVWHSLIILTKIDKSIPELLKNSFLNQICEGVEVVITGAYDGEGYIFWELTRKKNYSGNLGNLEKKS
ncbi:MAG: hypothetical protein S4CHLAM45_05240 [Chlamydiales bacterium]|nr:hypothetical protein [Chlamydiales bacterium]MCH9619935.1 hypothetical protein [Chlamydiales bacterium]MCH9622638.1 hypothetical protein [Chlamydiales bacterium]